MEKVIDCSGDACPLPLLKLKKALAQSNVGDILKVIATDPGSKRDIPAFIDSSKHDLVMLDEQDGRFVFDIQKG